MLSSPFRAFIAIDIPENIRNTIFKAINPLHRHQEAKYVRWTKQENFHITLVFLGNITYQQFYEINKKIKKIVTQYHPFTLKLVTLEPFPTAEKFHSLILRPEPLIDLQKLALAVKIQVEGCGVPTDQRQFKPHLTLGRLSSQDKILGETLSAIKLPSTHFKVTEIKLFKSEPQPEGSRYIPIATYHLTSNQ
jgi:RNA 2',3'-cyclic 3'-phosphodiesterase